jgi:hypothetical protein
MSLSKKAEQVCKISLESEIVVICHEMTHKKTVLGKILLPEIFKNFAVTHDVM